MNILDLAMIIGVIAAIITIYHFAVPIIIEKIEEYKKCANIKDLRDVPAATFDITQKIFPPKEGDGKILEVRPEKIYQIEVQEFVSSNRTITFFAAKKSADDIARTCLKDSKLVYSTLTSYDVFARANGEPYIRTYSWVYLYRKDKKFLLIHIGNDLKPIGHCYRWIETDEKNLSKYPFISEGDLSFDSDRVYEIAEENNVFLDKGSLVLTSVDTLVGILDSRYLNILDRGSPYWVLKGRYFINSKTGKLIDGADLMFELKGTRGEIKIGDKIHHTITYKTSIPSLNITFNHIVDITKGNVILQEYERWKNVYKYNWWGDITGIPIRAETINKTDNQTLAIMEIRFEDEKIVFSEKHFDGRGNITYEGYGEIHPATGFKQKEQTLSGKKILEYYHEWPLRKGY